MRLGDVIQRALATVGITEERVTALLGRPCGCARRRRTMNQVGAISRMLLGGKITIEQARQHFMDLAGDEK